MTVALFFIIFGACSIATGLITEAIKKLIYDRMLCDKMRELNIQKVKTFDISNVILEMEKIYFL